MTADLESRTAKRRAELEAAKAMEEYDREARQVRQLMEAPEIASYAFEFICAFGGGLMIMLGKYEASCALWLAAIYMKLRR